MFPHPTVTLQKLIPPRSKARVLPDLYPIQRDPAGRLVKNRGNNWLEQNAVDTVSRLLSTEGQFAKVEVAGSNPVSRSFFSITWQLHFTVLPNNYPVNAISVHKCRLELGDSLDSALKRRSGVDV